MKTRAFFEVGFFKWIIKKFLDFRINNIFVTFLPLGVMVLWCGFFKKWQVETNLHFNNFPREMLHFKLSTKTALNQHYLSKFKSKKEGTKEIKMDNKKAMVKV